MMFMTRQNGFLAALAERMPCSVDKPYDADSFGWAAAPLGIAFNLAMCLFLQPWTWVRFVGWLAIGLAIYYFYGRRHSVLGQRLQEEIARPGAPETGTRLDEMHEA